MFFPLTLLDILNIFASISKIVPLFIIDKKQKQPKSQQMMSGQIKCSISIPWNIAVKRNEVLINITT